MGIGVKSLGKTNYFRIKKNDCLKNYKKKGNSQLSQLQKKVEFFGKTFWVI